MQDREGHMMNCKWLPSLELFEDYKSWRSYEEHIYNIFHADFIKTRPLFEGNQVKVRFHPKEYGKEEGFYHVTCQDYQKDGERVPDLRRCERIRWVRSFIENYNCNLDECDECEGIKIWYEPYKSNIRVHILLEEEIYVVVVEKRERYCLLVTAFYIDKRHSLEKMLKRYNKYK